jgi:hypothetical protein
MLSLISRAWIGGALVALLFYAVSVSVAIVQLVFAPELWERVTAKSVLATALYLPVFLAAGALAGWLTKVGFRALRYLLIGAVCGALLWSYLTVTWPLTARISAYIEPQGSVIDAVLIGGVFGTIGGVLLALLAAFRDWRRKRE